MDNGEQVDTRCDATSDAAHLIPFCLPSLCDDVCLNSVHLDRHGHA